MHSSPFQRPPLIHSLKTGFTTDSGMDLAQGYTPFQKSLSIKLTHLPRFKILCISLGNNMTRYADFIGFCGTPPLKLLMKVYRPVCIDQGFPTGLTSRGHPCCIKEIY